MILDSDGMGTNFLILLMLGIFLMAKCSRMHARLQQLQEQEQTDGPAAVGRFCMSIALAIREGLQQLRPQLVFFVHEFDDLALALREGLQYLRPQLALLVREFDGLALVWRGGLRNLENQLAHLAPLATRGRPQGHRNILADHDFLRASNADNSHASSLSEEEINALPVHEFRSLSHHVSTNSQSDISEQQEATSSATINGSSEQGIIRSGQSTAIREEKQTCSICLGELNLGELIRSLPCLHQFHAGCIDPWLRRKGTCPVCKYRASSGLQ